MQQLFWLILVTGLSGAQRPRRPCSVELPRGFAPVPSAYRNCEVDRVARLQHHGRMEYTPPENIAGDWICEQVTMVFVVDTSGVPDPRTVRVEATTRAEWAAAVVGTLPAILYRPARLGGRPVRQIVRYQRSALIPKLTFLSGSRMATSAERWKPC